MPNEQMTPALLEHLTADERVMLERANAASEGPWGTVDHERECGGMGCTPNGCPGHLTGVAYNVDGPVLLVDGDDDGDQYQYEQADKDAKFIAHSRTDVPELLRRLAEVRRELASFRARVFARRKVDGCDHSTACTIWGDDGQGGTAEKFKEPLPCNCGALENFAKHQRDDARRALRELCVQVEKSNAVDDHGHQLKNLKALKDARVTLDAAAHAAKEGMCDRHITQIGSSSTATSA